MRTMPGSVAAKSPVGRPQASGGFWPLGTATKSDLGCSLDHVFKHTRALRRIRVWINLMCQSIQMKNLKFILRQGMPAEANKHIRNSEDKHERLSGSVKCRQICAAQPTDT